MLTCGECHHNEGLHSSDKEVGCIVFGCECMAFVTPPGVDPLEFRE